MSIVLYTAPMSSALPVEHALAELQLSVEAIRLDLAKGEARTPELLALNPNGKVPTLVVDGTPMFEAVAIIQWLGARAGVERGLWPAADAPELLQALSWTAWAYVTFGAVLRRFISAGDSGAVAELRHPAQRKHAHGELQQLLAILDERLRERPYLLGEAFTLVDVVVASTVTYAAYCEVSVVGHAHVESWLERFRARPSFQMIWGEAA